ncbi:MAG: FAD-dependent oxidoreductase, partial [Burkholderiales bacterium]|nr:FAD-dependent oxidoreductase [Burkholderiales bacterium]
MKRLVLAGGGHAHIEVLRDLAERPGSGIAVTLVTPRPRFVYTGMIPGVIAGHYRLEDCAIDLEALARRANAQFVTGAIFRVDAMNHRVHCADGDAIEYDLLSLDVGSRVATSPAAGLEHATLARPMETLVKGWVDVLSRARDGKIRSATVVGGGAGGVELALAMAYRLRREMPERPAHVRVITNTPVILPEFSAGARRRLRLQLGRDDIGVHVSATVTEVGPDFVRLDTGMEFASDATFWATGATAPPWIGSSGLATDSRGFLLTNDALQSVTDGDVFGVGDCATQEHHPRPKAG